MFNLQDLEVTSVVPTERGLFVQAKHGEPEQKYSFYISDRGRIEGKTTSGNWLELSPDGCLWLESKVQLAMLAARRSSG